MEPTCVPVGRLTDAELAVLVGDGVGDGARQRPRPALPAWTRLAPAERGPAAREAREALVARGLVTRHDAGAVDVRRDLRSVLTLRAAADTTCAVRRRTPRGGDHWYAHRAGDVVLLERVDDAGHHDFALAAAATLPVLVAAAVLHPDATAAETDRPHAETDWLRADVEVRSDDGPERRAWVSGPTGTWRVPADPTDPAAVHADLAAMVSGGGRRGA